MRRADPGLHIRIRRCSMNKLRMLVVTGLAAFSLAAAGVASAQDDNGSHLNIGSQSAGVGAGKIVFNPFSIVRK
jgi:hypothetical protein